MRSADGFHETVDLSIVNEDPRVMLTYQWDGIALLPQHGYPLRIYIPDRYGMKQPKWITEIEVSGEYEEGYWGARLGRDGADESDLGDRCGGDGRRLHRSGHGRSDYPDRRHRAQGHAASRRSRCAWTMASGSKRSYAIRCPKRRGLSGVITGRFRRASTPSRCAALKAMARHRSRSAAPPCRAARPASTAFRARFEGSIDNLSPSFRPSVGLPSPQGGKEKRGSRSLPSFGGGGRGWRWGLNSPLAPLHAWRGEKGARG